MDIPSNPIVNILVQLAETAAYQSLVQGLSANAGDHAQTSHPFTEAPPQPSESAPAASGAHSTPSTPLPSSRPSQPAFSVSTAPAAPPAFNKSAAAPVSTTFSPPTPPAKDAPSSAPLQSDTASPEKPPPIPAPALAVHPRTRSPRKSPAATVSSHLNRPGTTDTTPRIASRPRAPLDEKATPAQPSRPDGTASRNDSPPHPLIPAEGRSHHTEQRRNIRKRDTSRDRPRTFSFLIPLAGRRTLGLSIAGPYPDGWTRAVLSAPDQTFAGILRNVLSGMQDDLADALLSVTVLSGGNRKGGCDALA